MRYLTVGAWGDSFAGMGHAIRHKRETGESYGMLHYGLDPDIHLFMKEQNLFDSVTWLKPLSREHYREVVNLSSRSNNPVSAWLPQMLAGSGIKCEDVIPVHMHDIEFDLPVDRWYGAKLPVYATEWAKEFLEELGVDRFYLLNPISLQSTQREDHWPYWESAIHWLLNCTDEKYVLVGQEQIYNKIRHRNLVNVSGYTDSMLEVLALANRASGIITTCNSLSFWSIIQQIPAVVTSHVVHARSRYFWNWLACEPNRMIEYGQGVDTFATLVQAMQHEVS